MPGLPFWPAWSEAAVLYGGVLLVWALALYVTSRGEPHRVPVLAALAMTTLSVYLFGQALGGLSTDLSVWATWLARTWAGAALGPGFWLLLTQALVVEEGAEPLRAWATRLYWPLAVAVLALGGGFAVVGTITELVEQWSGASELNPVLRLGSGAVRHIPDGPLFGIFRWYALVCLVWATANIGLLWRSSGRGTPLHARFTWLLLSGVLFVLGVGELTIASSIFAVPGIVGHVALIIGMLVMGWNIARYGALLSGEVVTADFVAFGLGMLTIVGIYGALILVLAPSEYIWLERTLPILPVVMLTHVLIDTRGHLLDRMLYGPVVSTMRGQLKALANRVVLVPDPTNATAEVAESTARIVEDARTELRKQAGVTEAQAAAAAELKPLIVGALRHLNDLPALSRHRLLELISMNSVSSTTALEAAGQLRSELLQGIERLRPPGGARPSPGGSAGAGGWVHYLVLREAYVDGRTNREIMQRYWISEGSFYRAQRRAIDTLALDLAQRNHPTPA